MERIEKLQDARGRRTILDLSKEIIGKLHPIRVISHYPTVWECLCDCGNTTNVPIGNLHGNHRRNTTSCGCRRAEIWETVSEITRKRPYESLYTSFLYVCRKPGKETDIAYEDFLKLTEIHHCHYCDNPIVWAEYSPRTSSQAYYLDRKNNSRGYTKDNVVVCCTRCNRGKSDQFSYEEWVEIGKLIKAMRERKVLKVAHAASA